MLQQFNVVSRLKRLSQNKALKILIITSTIASLSYDTFYELFPVYMAGLWRPGAMEIAWYNAILSVAIAIIVAVLLALLFEPSKWSVAILFFLIGLAIAVTTTNYTVQVSNTVDEKIQGEVLGTMWGLRMLMDAITAIVGGLLIMVSYKLPIAFAAFFALLSWLVYCSYASRRGNQ